MALNKQGYSSRSLTGVQANIITDHQHNNASILSIDTSAIEALLSQDVIVIVAGFQGVNQYGDITTLGRVVQTQCCDMAGALQADSAKFLPMWMVYTLVTICSEAKKLMSLIVYQWRNSLSRGKSTCCFCAVCRKNYVPCVFYLH